MQSSWLACRVIVYQELQPSNKGAAGMFFRNDGNKLYLWAGIAHLLCWARITFAVFGVGQTLNFYPLLSAKFLNNKRKQTLPVWRVLESLYVLKSLSNRDNDANGSIGGSRKVGGWSSKIYFYKLIFLNLYFTDGCDICWIYSAGGDHIQQVLGQYG